MSKCTMVICSLLYCSCILLQYFPSFFFSSPPSPDTSAVSPASPTSSVQPPSVRKQPSVWRGFVMMQKVSKFVCTAYAVSGTCENLMETLPDTIHVCGRIPPSQVWDYLSQMKEGRKNQNKVSCYTVLLENLKNNLFYNFAIFKNALAIFKFESIKD